jgi:hypothetical protein
VAVEPFTVTVIGPVLAFCGIGATSVVALAELTVVARPPIVTAFCAGVLENPVPSIVTFVPACPYVGLNAAMTGPLAAA